VNVSFDTAVTAELVWSSLTDPAKVGRWFGNLSTELVPGTTARLEFGDGDFFDLADISREPMRRLAYSWRFMGIGPLDRVTWTIRGTPGGCKVTVTDEEDDRPRAAADELHTGWLDFTRRLRRFLATGETTRYGWRRELDVATEISAKSDLMLKALFSEPMLAEWLPIRPERLADGARLLPADGFQPALLEVAKVRHSDRGVSFWLGHSSWADATRCNVNVHSRPAGSIISVSHVGWERIGRRPEEGLEQRRRFSSFWITALERAREAAHVPSAQ
jgi:uncharacterized protein YndB with AHSA1/START domain